MPNDESLLQEAIRRGDATALAQFIELNRPKLLGALERKVGAGLRRKMELEDILQEVVARALRDLPKLDFGAQDPLGWLYQIIDRQIIDLHRYHFQAQKRDAGREISANSPMAGGEDDGGFAHLLVASMTSPSEAVSRDMRMMRIFEALNHLSEDMQQAVRWRYLENQPSQVIAERLGKTDAATRVLLTRAIRKLQTALGDS